MMILVVLHWMTYQKQSKEIKRLSHLLQLQNEYAKTVIKEAEEAQTRFKNIQSDNKHRRESLQKEIREKLDGNK